MIALPRELCTDVQARVDRSGDQVDHGSGRSQQSDAEGPAIQPRLVDDGRDEFRRTGSAVAAAAGKMMLTLQPGEIDRRNAHHGAPIGVET